MLVYYIELVEAGVGDDILGYVNVDTGLRVDGDKWKDPKHIPFYNALG